MCIHLAMAVILNNTIEQYLSYFPEETPKRSETENAPNSRCHLSAVNMDYPNNAMYKVFFSMFARPRFAFLLYFLCHLRQPFIFSIKSFPNPGLILLPSVHTWSSHSFCLAISIESLGFSFPESHWTFA